MSEAAAWRVASRTVLLTLFLLVLGWVIYQLQSVVVQVLLAVIFAAGMAPVVDRLSVVKVGRWGWQVPRGVVVLGLYLFLIWLVWFTLRLVVPPLILELEELARRLPAYAEQLEQALREPPPELQFLRSLDLAQSLAGQVQALASQLTLLLSQVVLVVRFAIGIVNWTLDAVFTLILALYITADSRRIVDYLLAFLPFDRQSQAARVAQHIGLRLGGWVRGQLLLSAIIGAITLLGLSLLDVKYALLLAIIAAIGEVVPLLGPIISAIPAVLIAFAYSPVQGLLTLALYVGIQQIENHLIVPRVMSRAVSLHPLAVMLALLVGSELMGIAGAILAVPVTAALSVIVDEIRRERVKQHLPAEEFPTS